MNVPFLDLKAQYRSIKDEVHAAIDEVIENTAFAGGPFVAKFEQEFAKFCDCKHAIGVGNGTDALWMSLVALGVGAGDEVITSPNTFIATAEAISLAGAKPVFVDVEEQTSNMNPALIQAAITPKTKAIIPVHLFGQPCRYGSHSGNCREEQPVCCRRRVPGTWRRIQGKESRFDGQRRLFQFLSREKPGCLSEKAARSYTNDDALAAKMRMFRDHGQAKKYYHDIIGWNARLDGIQGAVLNVKLKYLPAWNDARRKHAKDYTTGLSAVKDVILPAGSGLRKTRLSYLRHSRKRP